MHPHLAEVFTLLDASRDGLRAAVARVPAAARGQRPAPDRWSVNEILEHLALVETRFAANVAAALAQARATGLGPECDARVPLDDALLVRVVDRAERRTAPEEMLPTGTLDEAAAWQALDQAHETFRRTLLGGDGLALGGVVSDHRRFGTLTAYQWAEVVAGHEWRHVEQITEMAAERA